MTHGYRSKLSNEELIKIAEYLQSGGSLGICMDEEALSALAEQVVASGWQALEKDPTVSDHLLRCQQCFDDLRTLVELTSQPIVVSIEDAPVTFPFLQRSPWVEIGEKMWRLVEALQVRLERAQLQIDSTVAGLQWTPQLALATTRGTTRPDVSADTKYAPGTVGELSIPLPQGDRTARILLAGTYRGSRLVLLDVKNADGTLVSGVEASIRDMVAETVRTPRVTESEELDFGVLRRGSYELELSLEGETVVVSLELG
jgi:hypothetical protein